MENLIAKGNKYISSLATLKLLVIFSILYFVLRMWNLTILPIFNDEATYIDWGWRMVNLKGELFYSMLHGKTPLLMWLFGFSQNIFSDPLFAGRIVSVVAGLATLNGIVLISIEVFGKKVAALAALLYIFNPLFSLFDRQALMESSIAAVGVWMFYLYRKVIDTWDIKYALFLGIACVVGYYIKTNTLVFVLAICVLMVYKWIKSSEEEKNKIIKYFLISGLTAFFILLPLISQEEYGNTFSQNENYIMPVSQLLHFPVSKWFDNIVNLVRTLLVYFNPINMVAFLFGIFGIVRQKDADRKNLMVWFFIGLFVVVFLALFTIVRYTVSFLPVFLIFASFGFSILFEKKKHIYSLYIFSLCIGIYFTFFQIANPLKYFDKLDYFSHKVSGKVGYVNGWQSGYGVKEAIDFIKENSGNSRIVIGVRLDAGNPENSVFAYFYGSKRIIPTYFDQQILPFDINEVDCLETSVPLYFVSRDGNMTNLNKYFDELKRFYKPDGENFVGVHLLKKECDGATVKLF